MTRLFAFTIATLGLALPVAASEPALPQRVLFVGNKDTARTRAFVQLLEKHFASVHVAARQGFDPASAGDADVVLLDWSQSDANFPNDPSPLGERSVWNKPTVFLGSAGLLVAVRWQTVGGSG
ncbi:MAG TPA: hypothetical protein VG826_28220 [Pirellulales bacterium]|nr:hypothetical protein [Pirellulales bacterium]